jgi:hypothetical protein
MPYYGGYVDPTEQYQGSGFDPLTGRLQGGQLIAQFLQNLARQRDEKQQREWDVEDRDLKRRLVEAQIGNYGEQANVRDYETPEQRRQRELDLEAKKHEYRVDEIGKRGEASNTKATATENKKAADQEYQDKKRIYEQTKKERESARKAHSANMTKLATLDKRINEIKLKRTKARASQDPGSAAALAQEVERLESEKAVLQSQIDNTLESLAIPNIPAPKKQETKIIGGVTYYRWSDGKWYPNKEGSQTTK